MSGFALIYQRRPGRGQAPVAGELLPAMMSALEHRGADGVDSVAESGFALGHRHFWVTPEERGEKQPVTDGASGVWLVFDGRLDNRAELLEVLNESDRAAGDLSDARIVMAAYRRWGSDCFSRFSGPFAAAVRERHGGVVCARDPLGDRGLYYLLDSERLLVASEEQAILAVPGVSDSLDENRLAHYFAVRVPDDASTFFDEIRELRPGQLLRVDGDRSSFERYSDLPIPEPIRFRDDRDYAARYRELLGRSVACRTRSAGGVAVMMSGGLDSTSLVAVAANAGVAGVRPASWVFDELESCDERRFMDPLVERYRLFPIRFQGDGHWPLRVPDLYAANPNAPEENAYRGLKRHLYRSVAAEGCRTVLTGGSADLFYFGYQSWLADLLSEGRLIEVGLSGWSEIQKRGPRSALGALMRKMGLVRPASESWFSRTPWLTPEASRRLTRSSDERWSDHRRPAQCRNVFGARQAHSLAREVFHANRAGVELRHPYRDRRLIDFMLAIPAHQLYRRGRFKHVAREAVRDLLPPVILERSDRTLLTPLFERGLWRREAKFVREIVAHPDAVWPHFVRREWLSEVLESGAKRPMDGVVLWQCVALELWRRRWGRP